jgi:hypothetical protein
LVSPAEQQIPLELVFPGGQQMDPMHVVPDAQQSSVWEEPQPTAWLHPASL